MSDPSQEAATDRRARLRRSARLSAVQALYQMETSGSGAKAVVKEFRDHRFGYEDEPGDYVETDEDFFEDLVTGIVSIQADVDKRIGGVLKEGWKLSRLDATVRAILRAGGYELIARKDVPPAVVINEYVDVAHAFFEDSEPGFVNATLDALAKQVRDA
ncbi:MAG: transcription antitermination factor NusB [Oceanicaulis sp.]|uniref:transcription antitermination factor NusB n=1 Tax=unclassified Oceanicaulis TaxID=2632123 RepID=UPI000C3F4CD9|nr:MULTISPECIES: transcription antitermination factor NusB [unclassified Oceanicaulis]MBC38505.1 transcription antitermination factor NusB [Oceanicaulis sp.]MBG37167.1 transcription antitermination factor NusB [Oceanicaulis sp.]|tara:strand:+ start:9965 stop:10441 length:477 start_codon:yes stop_codon:yes gene_type:complete